MRKPLFYMFGALIAFSTYSCDKSEGEIVFNLKMDQIESVIPCSDTLDEPYGVCAHITKAADNPYIDGILDIMDDLQITWVRSDIEWTSLSSQPGQMDYTYFDNVFSHLEKHPKIHLLPILTYYGNYPNQSNLQIQDYYSDWLAYLDGVVSRYQQYCPIWEGFNEWEYWLYNGQIEYDEAKKYQYDIYKAVKKYNPDAPVLLGSMGWGEAFRNLSATGVSKYYDIANLHSYSTFAPENNYIALINQLADVYKKYSFEKQLWITEFGYSTARGYLTEEEQAFLIPRSFISGFALGVGKMFLYSLRSREYDGQVDDKESHFGITHKDLSPKQAYTSVRNLTRMLPSGSTRPKLYNFNTIYISCWVHPELGKVYAIWNNGDAKNVCLKYQGTPHCYSYMDIENELDIEDFNKFEIGPGIIYITGITTLSLS